MPTQVNPATGEEGDTFPALNDDQIEVKLAKSVETFRQWRNTDYQTRTDLLIKIADQFAAQRTTLAAIVTKEMGKPVKQALTEMDKCEKAFRFYAENGPAMLAPTEQKLVSGRSVSHWLPYGPVLAVMPWNYPFWQVVRFMAPTIMAGNVGLLKHASSTPGCAAALEQIVLDAGGPEGLFQNLHISSSKVAGIIADDRIVAVTITGSEFAGQKVAEAAGFNLKKVVLELGGSDPFIVMPSADIEKAATTAVTARLQNAGQSCVCGKRMIVHEDVYDAFMEIFAEGVKTIKIGDPTDEITEMGPLSSEGARDEIAEQLEQAVQQGATKLYGGEIPDKPGAWMTPAILTDIPDDAPIAREEFFGPVAMVFKVKDLDEAIEVANNIPFGLGSSAWTNDESEKERFIRDIEAGMTAINQMLASDPYAPFGGIKRSGHGRELGSHGLHEFMNLKNVMLPE
ncbi:NAD-dependent succinate-semialdehyde dehydrogenase [Parasphingopyxis lamellibrachiae]|uniref:Succinate-semialdehyde dehydrogenase/glutarate-semialdehyde dehydrogenase n=1 Tax=Parasphingopyxis lamellibrachiae TaxID=680125 RepID=A0A3D9FDT8_9SPHN|nr:NAD-dependent succinate-semialdehyde dehydrogenase [Parasphingopyxis lamellibrachiae]RED15994.1 succinate-semialdehyde dehydrogenase/glutarate-semialdehyde dehydrogenase [Parasphingopyxis lamellibrachiae]